VNSGLLLFLLLCHPARRGTAGDGAHSRVTNPGRARVTARVTSAPAALKPTHPRWWSATRIGDS